VQEERKDVAKRGAGGYNVGKGRRKERAGMAGGRVYGSPVSGAVLRLSQCEDASFGQGLLGRGVLLMPTTTTVKSPADGEIAFVMGTGHAVGLQTAYGEQMIVHVGLDTHKLSGRGFWPHVQRGDKVQRGDSLLTFDGKGLAAEGCTQAVLLVLSSPRSCIRILKLGPVSEGEDLICLY